MARENMMNKNNVYTISPPLSDRQINNLQKVMQMSKEKKENVEKDKQEYSPLKVSPFNKYDMNIRN